MVAAVASTPAAPVHVKDACRIDVTGASTNRAPNGTGGEFRYYLAFLLDGAERNRSYVFNVSSDGKHQFNSFVFDTAGAWTVNLCDAVGDGTVATASVTVS